MNKWMLMKDFDLNFYLNPKLTLEQVRAIASENDALYFVVSDVDHETAEIQKDLDVRQINEMAKTVGIMLRDVNAKKASDIVNAIADEYISYDVERKSESSKNIISFIDSQLGNVYNTLKSTESD